MWDSGFDCRPEEYDMKVAGWARTLADLQVSKERRLQPDEVTILRDELGVRRAVVQYRNVSDQPGRTRPATRGMVMRLWT
jgi:hypothetical protein